MKHRSRIIHEVLATIRPQLDLSSQTERELLDELRAHLEDAADAALAKGQDEETAILKAAEALGAAELGMQLHKVHAPWESADAIVACGLPVLLALVMRWLLFAPDGSAGEWTLTAETAHLLLLRPAFWLVAMAALLVPLLQFRRWRYALVGWGIFWALTLVFALFPVASRW
jgi:hypothetical protein